MKTIPQTSSIKAPEKMEKLHAFPTTKPQHFPKHTISYDSI